MIHIEREHSTGILMKKCLSPNFRIPNGSKISILEFFILEISGHLCLDNLSDTTITTTFSWSHWNRWWRTTTIAGIIIFNDTILVTIGVVITTVSTLVV